MGPGYGVRTESGSLTIRQERLPQVPGILTTLTPKFGWGTRGQGVFGVLAWMLLCWYRSRLQSFPVA